MQTAKKRTARRTRKEKRPPVRKDVPKPAGWENSVRERIRALQQSEHLTQAEFGWRCGVHARRVTSWLSTMLPSADNLRRIAAAFDVSLHWLLLGEGAMRRSAPAEPDLGAAIDSAVTRELALLRRDGAYVARHVLRWAIATYRAQADREEAYYLWFHADHLKADEVVAGDPAFLEPPRMILERVVPKDFPRIAIPARPRRPS